MKKNIRLNGYIAQNKEMYRILETHLERPPDAFLFKEYLEKHTSETKLTSRLFCTILNDSTVVPVRCTTEEILDPVHDAGSLVKQFESGCFTESNNRDQISSVALDVELLLHVNELLKEFLGNYNLPIPPFTVG